MQSEKTIEIFRSNQYLVLLAMPSNQNQYLIGTIVQSQGFYRIIVKCMINQLHNTGVRDHQCHT